MAAASAPFLLTVLLLIVIVIFPKTGYDVAAIPIKELEAMNRALRSKGYNRIGNAIATSDLTFDFISANAVTLFAPSDSSLYDLDMTLTAASYVSVLRYHAVPRRLTVSDLHSSVVLPTLISNSSLNVTVDKSKSMVSVNGVQLETPGIYNGSHVTVHGLSGALNIFSGHGRRTIIGSPVNGAPSPLPPAPPFEAPRDPTPIAVEGAYPMWILPPETQMNMSPFSDIPQAANQLRRPAPGRRRRTLSRMNTKRQSQVPPAPARAPAIHGNVNGRRLRLPERVKTDTEARHLHRMIEEEEVGPSIDQNLRRELFRRYAADPYSIWNDNSPLCNHECIKCRICLSRCSSC